MKAAVLAAAGVAAMLIGFAGGRATAPVKTVEKTVTKTVEVASKTKEDTSVETRQADVHTVTRWRIHVVENPNGQVVTTADGSTRADDGSKSSSEKAERETQVVYRDREVEKVVIKESGRPQWALGALIGTNPSRITREPAGYGSFVYGGVIERRIIGGLGAGVYAKTDGEAGLLIRWEF